MIKKVNSVNLSYLEEKADDLIAEGKAELCIKEDPHTKEWDTAPSEIIVKEAGGIMSNVYGEIMKYNRKDVYNHDGFLIANTKEILDSFIMYLPKYITEVGFALLPIIIFFVIYQIFVIKMPKKEVLKVFVGCFYELIGLTLFLLGANVGFLQVGSLIGGELASLGNNYLLIIVSMIIGYFIVIAEPAVGVLNKQVSEITDGAIPENAIKTSLSIGVSIAVGLSIIRIITGISILWFVIPGYLLAIILAFLGSDIFTAIAFDSGGVASGTMASAFLVPFAIGISVKLGANVLADAFGVIALVAMAPIITIQISGLIYKVRLQKIQKKKEIGEIEDSIIEIDWM